jgi:DNA invertase Pin-like site-specific DNA recombinase
MKIGYARVSTQDQDLALQLAALKKAGCEKIYSDKASGRNAERQGLQAALLHLRAGDTLCVWRLDRLGRSMNDLVTLLEGFKSAGVHFESVTEQLDTSTPMGAFLYYMAAAFSQMQRDQIVENTNAGLLAARAKGKIGGRPRKVTEEKLETARLLIASGQTYPQTARALGVAASTLYTALPVFAEVMK